MSRPNDLKGTVEVSRRKLLVSGSAAGMAVAAGMSLAATGAQREGAAQSATNRTSPTPTGRTWKSVLELDSRRTVTSGSPAALCDAIRRGADLRILTEFVYNEHIDTSSKNTELVREVADFRVTYLLEDRWAAGIMSLRMPISPPHGFGSRASMSFFMYNQDGQQAIARPYLDGPPAAGHRGPSPLDDHSEMPKYHQQDNWDADTNAPSSNFVYDFNRYRYLVRDDWEEVFAHTADGAVMSGSIEALDDAFTQGREIKVGIRGLCSDMVEPAAAAAEHTVFVQAGPGYYCTGQKLFCAGSQPVIRVRPGVPVRYTSGGWDFGWLMPRSDGLVARWLCDPYTLRFHSSQGRYAIRWFVR